MLAEDMQDGGHEHPGDLVAEQMQGYTIMRGLTSDTTVFFQAQEKFRAYRLEVGEVHCVSAEVERMLWVCGLGLQRVTTE